MRTLAVWVVATSTVLLTTSASCQDGVPTLAVGWPLPSLAVPRRGDGMAEQDADVASDLLDLGWETFLTPFVRFAPLPAELPVILTFQDSVDLIAHERLTRFGVSLPVGPATPSGALNLEASAGNHDDLKQANRTVQDVGVAAKLMLPESLHAWYLKATADADTQQSEETGLSLGSAQDMSDGSRVTFSIGMTNRETRKPPHRRIIRNALTGSVQWMWSERLGIGIRLNYHPDGGAIDGSMTLDVLSRVPP